MNWFDTSGFTSLAKTALKEAQKTIDKALDIQDESSGEQEDGSPTESQSVSTPGTSKTSPKDSSDFFSSWGLTVSAESDKDDPIQEQPVVTESPSKSATQSVWGSFAGSFFEQPNTKETVTVRPPKAKSMNVISDKYDSHEDLFSKSQLVISDTAEMKKSESNSRTEERRSSSRSNRLSLVSSRNSSDSVEVLSHSLKSTPESEPASVSHSSSMGLKLNSESVEILPDSLVSPSSIECLGFDSYTSDKNSSTSSLSPGDLSDKISTPCDRTERAETGDSVSLVADDDEDTMSYNSISECTAPTVLDTDDKPISPFQKAKFEPKKGIDIVHVEQPSLSQRMQISENSSNDGSWSDRTLNADNDSINLDVTLEEKKDPEEDALIEKLSDSSSFYNVNMSADMIKSEISFVNVEKQCVTDSSDSSQKECSLKERNSPVSSDSKSDLVKIGSDRTSGHTSGDEVETATSSDIEIIPSPNGDNHFRGSPGKYIRPSKLDGATSPNLVDLVLGKSLATKIRGHNRELSETSIQSNVSDESQGSESERMMRRLCEMAEILEARENRLMEVSRSNTELAESNAELKTQVETLMSRHEVGDISTITEDYTQRMSALEKKFQQAIREKDQLRKQLDALKSDSSRKISSEFENSLKEKDEVIAQLQEEGEKLAKQQLQHSNIIKKLRTKEKDNEQVIKNLRDKIAEQTSELDRVKRALAAKEEIEVSQIEAVYHLTTANKKLETELLETKSSLDDMVQRLESARASLEAARGELAALRRGCGEHAGMLRQYESSCAERARAEERAARLQAQLEQLRVEFVSEQKRWASREAALQEQLAAGLLAEPPALAPAPDGALLAQLAALQRACVDKEVRCGQLAEAVAQTETSLAKAIERERLARDEALKLRESLATCERQLRDAGAAGRRAQGESERLRERERALQEMLDGKTGELERLRIDMESQVSCLLARVSETEQARETERALLEAEKKRTAILQERVSSPAHSVASDPPAPWASEEAPAAWAGLEEALAAAARLQGSLAAARAARAALAAERDVLRRRVAELQADREHCQSVQEQYDALLDMYGEKEEQLSELRLDLLDVTQLYKAQLDELLALKRDKS